MQQRQRLSAIAAIALAISGCAPSLRPEPGTPTATREDCESLDSGQQAWGTATAIVLFVGALGFTTSLLAKPDSPLEKASLGVGAAGAYGGFLGHSFQQKSVREYREKRCGNRR